MGLMAAVEALLPRCGFAAQSRYAGGMTHHASSGATSHGAKNAATLPMTGILLFAHGSRDSNWKKPFESLLEETRRQAIGPVVLAFLESMQPDFDAGVRELAAQGVAQIRVVPVFLAAGSHLREDLPKMLAAAQSAYPSIKFSVTAAIGELAEIQSAIARYAANA